jgi:hypothetical protein
MLFEERQHLDQHLVQSISTRHACLLSISSREPRSLAHYERGARRGGRGTTRVGVGIVGVETSLEFLGQARMHLARDTETRSTSTLSELDVGRSWVQPLGVLARDRHRRGGGKHLLGEELALGRGLILHPSFFVIHLFRVILFVLLLAFHQMSGHSLSSIPEYSILATEWRSLVFTKWCTLKRDRLLVEIDSGIIGGGGGEGKDRQARMDKWNHHLLNHQKLYLSALNKIRACLKAVRHNPWIKQHEIRSECIEYAITSHSREILQPTLQMLTDNEIPYVCCLTEQAATWNEKHQFSTCLRIQFTKPHTSIWFTLDMGMLNFIIILSFLGHIEPFLEQEVQKAMDLSESSESEFPPAWMLEFEDYFMAQDLVQSMQYVYKMIYKHIIPPTIQEIEQSFLKDPHSHPRHVSSKA